MSLSVATLPTPPPMSFGFEPEHESLEKVEQKQRLWDWLRRSRREEQRTSLIPEQIGATPPSTPNRPGLGRRISRKVGVGIPRSTTFRRQEEEQRKNLEPVQPTVKERRDVSVGRQRAFSAQPLPPKPLRRKKSAPEAGYVHEELTSIDGRISSNAYFDLAVQQEDGPPPPPKPDQQNPLLGMSSQEDDDAQSEGSCDDSIDEQIKEELEKKWILNLSMHFRDKSPREKFFLTYAEAPQKWRRVTVSCDYRDTPQDSLEADLQKLTSQRDKSARIYESIRMSLSDIQFYDTVTNLKLETRDDRLHVHVTEDVNEIIPYPPVRSVQHLPIQHFKESELRFVEHMSGFVYKVDVGQSTWVKKEIPGPDSVDEFLYEVNALSSLVGAKNVIELKGLVVDEDDTLVKGLLIAYAEKNALVDVIYDNQGNLPWSRRERWAQQIVHGLSEIHEAGFVQGDFTLSNVVIDENDEAKIIDINRRGCPVGWEPPEIAKLIENGQRISMFIGVKSDLFQLGMVLWGLAMEEDEPERQPRPLSLRDANVEIPDYYRALTSRCLSSKPPDRLAAKDLVSLFPELPHHDWSPGLLTEVGSIHPPLSTSTAYDPVLAPTMNGDYHSDNHPDIKEGDLEYDDILKPQQAPWTCDRSPRALSPKLRSMEALPAHERAYHRPEASATLVPASSQAKRQCSYRDERPLKHMQPHHSQVSAEELAQRNTSGVNTFPQRDANQSSYFPFDDLGSHTIPNRGRQPPTNMRHLSTSDCSPGHSECQSPQIIPVSPTGGFQWEQITMDGTPYLVHRETLDSLDDNEAETARKEDAMPRLPLRTQTGSVAQDLMRGFSHVDSGLADMDFNGEDGPLEVSRGAVEPETMTHNGDVTAVGNGGDEDKTAGMEKVSGEGAMNSEAAHIET